MRHDERLVLIGKVAATHGIRGHLRIVPYSGDAGSILSRRTLILRGSKGESDVFEVETSSVHGRKVLVTLKSFTDINKVEHLVGREVYVERDQLPDLPEGEYYWHDLMGLKVFTTQGNLLGVLSDILATGSSDVYAVRSGDREYLIPAVEGIVTSVDLREGCMIVDPPEGLLDL